MQPPAYAMVQRDGFQIHFAKGDEFTPNEKYRKETTDIVIYVPEIENFYNEIKVNNAEIIMELTQKAHGKREFIIKDCNGYKILVGE